MPKNLRSRLARIREAAPGRAGADREADRGAPGTRPPFLASWTEAGECLWTRTALLPCLESGGGRSVPLALFSRSLAGLEARPGGVAFFDLETTGLSGSSGTVAFLAAVGRLQPDGAIAVAQFFLSDFPGETAFVEAVREELEKADAIASFNGASFDLPLFSVRCVMCGTRQLSSRPHADVIHATRRLWKRVLPDCSLARVEAELLGVRRRGDIDGKDIPEAWLSFVKTGAVGEMASVLEHNALDVASLARLFMLIASSVEGGRAPMADPVGLAALVSRVDGSRAEAILRSAVEAGEARAARPLMRIYWKSGRRDERLDLAPRLEDDGPGLLCKSLYEERRRGNLEEALRLAEEALARASPGSAVGERAARRAARLARRLRD